MPTVLRVGGFAVRIYKHDHEPAHVHVHNAEGWCKVEIATGRVTKAMAMRPLDALRAARVVEANEKLLARRWEEIHGGA